jgi:hypothetical protein
MSSLDKFFVRVLHFQSDAEATNFSAHVGWSLAFPLAGLALAGQLGMYLAAALWVSFAFVNEIVFHGPTSTREWALDLVSRLLPCMVVLFLAA